MNDVSRILEAIEGGDAHAGEDLLVAVYDELRQLAARRLGRERPGQTLQATALVHEAYLRLVGAGDWDSKRHFFAAAAEAMRRILLNRARDKRRQKRGGALRRLDLDQLELALDAADEELVALDEAIAELAADDPTSAELVKLRFFAGMSQGEAATALGLARRTADRYWAFARAWLYDKLRRLDDV